MLESAVTLDEVNVCYDPAFDLHDWSLTLTKRRIAIVKDARV